MTKTSPLSTSSTSPKLADGWKYIHVFYGDDKHLANNRAKSQCRQDELVEALFHGKNNGYFVDLAANDATTLSNTYGLEVRNNWNGLCVEPNPHYWKKLSYRKCEIVAAVIGAERKAEVKFKFHEGSQRAPSGGIEDAAFDNAPNTPKTQSTAVNVYTVPLLEVLESFHVPKVMDYFSLDVEGAEYFVMKDFPFDQYRFRVLTIERPKQELVDLLYASGYRYLAANNNYGEETLWAHKDELHLLDLKAISMVEWLAGETKYMKPGPTIHDPPTIQRKTLHRG
jgi:FkbM family methyltransferase